ncbi:hypothetical protein S40288_05753 [Stachybotrys chartarum IBT 40288]|nr:hypothetical protein S40288_05753 [Stachybotrys chartarum IBT 40288]
MATAPNFDGLKWIRTLWGLEPRWAVKLDKKAIGETVKKTLSLPENYCVKFLAKGAFNKLYIITSGQAEVVVRVTLPVDPKWKTLSEVATLQWVSHMTSLPVPRVLAYNIDRSNPIGFEWIIMDKLPGKPWADVWKELPFDEKEAIVNQLASFCSETFRQQMVGIGSLFGESDAPVSTADDLASGGIWPNTNTDFKIRRMVSTSFISQRPIPQMSRGPFTTAAEWLSTQLVLAETDCRQRLASIKRTDPNDEKDCCSSDTVNKAAFDSEPEPSMLYHDDLNRHNILINEDGTLSAVVDWECIPFLPLSIACQYPPFLQGKPHDVEPIQAQYEDESGEVAELYWEHLENYELTQLRRLFLEKMRKLQPGWVEIFMSSQRQRDFALAVEAADDPFMIRRILAWLHDLETGGADVLGLEERIDNAL